MLRALEASLDAWFVNHRRGDGSSVFVFGHGRKVWILIRHGMPFKREGSVKAGKSSSEYYRPEIHAVLIYDTEVDDIGVHAGTKGARDVYLRLIGQHLFGDAEYFPQADKFTLDPLIEPALRCDDVPGLDGVLLTEFHRYWAAISSRSRSGRLPTSSAHSTTGTTLWQAAGRPESFSGSSSPEPGALDPSP